MISNGTIGKVLRLKNIGYIDSAIIKSCNISNEQYQEALSILKERDKKKKIKEAKRNGICTSCFKNPKYLKRTWCEKCINDLHNWWDREINKLHPNHLNDVQTLIELTQQIEDLKKLITSRRSEAYKLKRVQNKQPN